MNNIEKTTIINLVKSEVKRLGSQHNVAKFLGINQGIVSHIVNGNLDEISDDTLHAIGVKCGWRPDAWVVVETTDFKIISTVCTDAQRNALWIPISHKAGGGKSEGLREFAMRNKNTLYVQCREWKRRELMTHLLSRVGLDINLNDSTDKMSQSLFDFFLGRDKPLLILDEWDKLTVDAQRFMIPLYNETKGHLGLVISGTEYLEQNIKQRVTWRQKGFDEIDSRLGRNFIHLIGATKRDVTAICKANGIDNENAIAEIWQECTPVDRNHDHRTVKVVTDLRRLERVIQARLISKQSESAA